MGKTYLFVCEKCDYRVAVAGGFSEGCDLKVQTVRCRDCRALYDCVIELRHSSPRPLWKRVNAMPEDIRPNLASALNRLPVGSSDALACSTFAPRCPVDETHRIELWTTPGRCPKCRAFMERGALPFRLWD